MLNLFKPKKITMRLIRILFLFILTICSLDSISQDFNTYIDSVYGLNPNLYNGQHNPNNIPANIKGHAFFKEKDYRNGTVTLNGKIFKNTLLNYDVYNQDILMSYTDKYGSESILKLSNLNIESFSILDKKFEVFGDQNKIYQSIGDGKIKVFYAWMKIIQFKSTNDYRNYRFSKLIQTRYIFQNNKLCSYKNNRSFLKCFDEKLRLEVKAYMKKNKIKVKKASDNTIYDLLTYCNSLII